MTYRTMYNGRCHRFSIIEYTNVIHHRSICFIQPNIDFIVFAFNQDALNATLRLHQGPLTVMFSATA